MIDERNYRLSSCLGFAAFDPGGRIGFVADLRYGSRSDRPDFLVIRRGRVRRGKISVPVEQVVEIDMAGRKVIVHGAAVGRIRWSHPAEEMEGAATAPFANLHASRDRSEQRKVGGNLASMRGEMRIEARVARPGQVTFEIPPGRRAGSAGR